MAKVIITIEDLPNGKVKTTFEPSIESLIKKTVSGHDYTSAEGYAMFVQRQIREISKKLGSTIPVFVPKLK